ncbi:hypothetical protein BKY29_02765 [Weissella confusa]|uniref:hypothetical protein n=1 Tax=Weissella confusa TaxID=1583 RepID=UPI0008FE1A3F|nr:hypothetical protein [Weissella confusa]OJF04158.1 hypothetical protein BKY29_02765 [Weissella confusa]
MIDELRGVDRQEGIPKKRVQRLYLPGDAKSWNVYRAGGPWSVGHQVGQLQPAKFGGLDCEVLAWKISGIVAVIKTKDFGVVGIYVAVGSIHPFFCCQLWKIKWYSKFKDHQLKTSWELRGK